MRNLKNFNHWIAELRDLATNYPVKDLDEDTGETYPISLAGIKLIFNKESYEDDFKDGLTPDEAFENTLDGWRDTQ